LIRASRNAQSWEDSDDTDHDRLAVWENHERDYAQSITRRLTQPTPERMAELLVEGLYERCGEVMPYERMLAAVEYMQENGGESDVE
jgi:hypothetical protein